MSTPDRARSRTHPPDGRGHPQRGARTQVLLTFLRQALAVGLAIVTLGFASGVPSAASPGLAVAYAVSGLCLAIAAWRLWWPTMQ